MPTQSQVDLIAERLDELPDRPALPLQANPIRATQKAAQRSAGIYRAYLYLSARIGEPWQLPELHRQFQQTVEDGPDFLKVRREAAARQGMVTTFASREASTNCGIRTGKAVTARGQTASAMPAHCRTQVSVLALNREPGPQLACHAIAVPLRKISAIRLSITRRGPARF